jgi:NAD(P)H-hydrate epimerase
MEHAGAAVARLALDLREDDRPVTILCGPGNNGGDGYACARFLASWGVPVRVVRCAARAPAAGDAALEHALAAACAAVDAAASLADAPLVARALDGAGVLVDALFGTGLSRALEEPYPTWIAMANASDARRLAVDVPSGLDADDGRVLPVAVRAHVTATMAAPKRGFFLGEGPSHAGRVVEVDIGLPAAVHRPHLA